MTIEFGDFQTPRELTAAVLRRLGPIGERWARVLEPTCGSGNFIKEILSLESAPDEIIGIELQPHYFAQAARLAGAHEGVQVRVFKRNIFDVDVGRDLAWRATGPLLVLGNPPWVTNAAISQAGGSNVPAKSNLKGLRGLDAKTGSANFDIAEYIILKIMTDLEAEPATIAMLCKTGVARNVLEYASQTGVNFGEASLIRIDAQEHFGAFVDACLFTFALNQGTPVYEADVFASLSDNDPLARIGMVGGRMVSDVRRYQALSFADGKSALGWRSGIKHDASAVFELTRSGGGSLVNKAGAIIDVEPEFVYPLLKATDLFIGESLRLPSRALVLPQTRLGEDTSRLRDIAPKLWRYLSFNADALARRKSKIYLDRFPFSVFGVGDYSFAPYKVAISGLHKQLRFRSLGPVDGRPVMLDDTCYFAPFRSPIQAALACALLNDAATLDFLSTLVFLDSKRPVTKRVLQRVDLSALLARCKPSVLLECTNAEYRRLTGAEVDPGEWPEDLQALLIAEEPEVEGRYKVSSARR